MASVLINISRNRHGTIIRGVRVLQSQYDKQAKRDKLVYLGTIAQGGVGVPATIAQRLTTDECEHLKAQLLIAAKVYWCQRASILATQLKAVHKAQESLGVQYGVVPTEVAQGPTDGDS